MIDTPVTASREPVGGSPDGSHLREPGRSQRRAERACLRAGYPRDVLADGNERRRDSRVDRGGHTFGKTHGAADADKYVGPKPEAAPLAQQGLGWRNSYGTGSGDDTISSGLEGPWTPHPTTWDNSYLETLFGYEWDLTKSPAQAHTSGCPQIPAQRTSCQIPTIRPSAPTPVMLTTDLALRLDPIYEPIARNFLENPDQFADAFARAWFKLTHRDMGPVSRYRGPEVPAEQLIWQDPVPAVTGELIDADDVAALKETLRTAV